MMEGGPRHPRVSGSVDFSVLFISFPGLSLPFPPAREREGRPGSTVSVRIDKHRVRRSGGYFPPPRAPATFPRHFFDDSTLDPSSFRVSHFVEGVTVRSTSCTSYICRPPSHTSSHAESVNGRMPIYVPHYYYLRKRQTFPFMVRF